MPDLPSGTVTFLFTDIEGSATLWERDRTAMQAAVQQHDTLIAETVRANNGFLFKRVGDAAQAAFTTARDALAAAVAAQQALQAAAWPGIDRPRVRMALHAGEALPDATGDYHQIASLNRLARLLGTGHGDQILLTEAVRRLLDGALPAGVTLKDLGQHQLRGLNEPEHIWQVAIPGLPHDFPPLRNPTLVPSNLPLQLSSLFGRETDVARVRALFEQDGVRLVTLTGPGGTGKTRLAVAVAAELVETFPDGVWFVDLALLTDPAFVASAIASALGIRETSAQSLPDALQVFLGPRRLLLVLDNFEHLLDAAPLVSDLLRAAPGAAAMVTSREALRLRGEREIAVSPLALPGVDRLPALDALSKIPAVALFLERAQAAKADFALTEANARDIVAICRRLDGLPLAIELAAARVKLMPPAALLARLDRGLSLLTGGARDAPQRQRTLRDTIAWSHDLLAPDERTLFGRLAVFVGGCTLEAAEAVANADGKLDILTGISALVDENLLRQEEGSDGEPRFRMLETIREYGIEQLSASGEEGTIRLTHATFYLARAELCAPWSLGPGLRKRVAQLEVDEANFRAALEYFDGQAMVDEFVGLAGTLFLFWYARGRLPEGRHWLDRAVALSDVSPAARARALFGVAWLARFQGDGQRAIAVIEESLELWRMIGDDWGEAQALFLLGTELLFGGELDRAEPILTEALTKYQARDDKAEAALTFDQLGILAGYRGDFTRSSALLETALVAQRALDDEFGIAYSLLSLASFLLHARNDVSGTAAMLRESIKLNRELGHVVQLAWCFHCLAHAAALSSRPEQGARMLGAEAALRGSTGVVVPPVEQAEHERIVTLVKNQLRPEAFAEERIAGEALTLDRAVAEALVLADDLAGDPVRP